MGLHTVAYSASVNEAGNLTYLTPVPDATIRVQGNDIIVPVDMNLLIGEHAMVGANGSQARLVSPSIRRVNPLNIQPLVLGLVPEKDNPLYLHETSPVILDANEALDCQTVGTPGAAEQHTVVLMLCDKAPVPVGGKIVKARFSITGAVVAGVWTNLAITLDDPLPVGVYNCVGANLIGSGLIAFRFYPVGQAYRPGAPCAQTAAGHQDPKFRNGGLGVWFAFNEIILPTVDVLASANAGSTTYRGVMDLIPV